MALISVSNTYLSFFSFSVLLGELTVFSLLPLFYFDDISLVCTTPGEYGDVSRS